MEERNSQWVMDPLRFSCLKYDFTTEEMVHELEAISGRKCAVTFLETKKGNLRQYICGEKAWFMTDSEEVCEDIMTALKEPESPKLPVTWIINPQGDSCERVDGSIADVMALLASMGLPGCQLSTLSDALTGANKITCGKKSWIVSEDEATCSLLQRSYLEFQLHSI